MLNDPNKADAGWLLDQLVTALERAGWAVDRDPSMPDGSPDLLAVLDGHRYSIEAKEVREKPRRSHVRAFLADAILRARATARLTGTSPLAVLGAPLLTDRMLEELREYVDLVAPDVAWGGLDERGRVELHGPGLEGVHSPPRRVRTRGAPANVRRQDPFSDLGQWVIKVLLAPHLPASSLSAPRTPLHGVADLARAARVSEASASRLVHALDSLGHIHASADGLRLVRVPELLRRWRESAQRQPLDRPARFQLTPKDVGARLESVLGRRRSADASTRACLGLFSACRKLGLGWVRGAPHYLLVEEDSPQVLEEEFGLREVEHHSQADVIVRRPRSAESVFRGCVSVKGIATADVLQCWLDVSSHPARGAEQAQEILERVGLAESFE